MRSSLQPAIPIIALTADSMQTDRDRCLDAGMNDYLSKPTDLGQLAAVIARWLPVTAAETTQAPGPLTGPRPAAIPSVPATVVFNVGDLLERLGDRELAEILVQRFLKGVPAQFSNLRARLADQDANGIRSQSHTLKGSSATVAAEDLRAIAEALEQAAAASQFDRCSELLPRALEEFERYKSTLQLAGWI
jgi:HPt (histidine-containing phosphotransfer) domain-containing protein